MADTTIGQRFGTLTVLARATNTKGDGHYTGRVRYRCRCDCGLIAVVRTSWLPSGKAKCRAGCKPKEEASCG